ncbi:MAG: DUF2059 domain-containing protein [Gammaproteobacteria bacterium]|nr:DUF2059 domain-containing protein [Gammaproteobacteria bacterium]
MNRQEKRQAALELLRVRGALVEAAGEPPQVAEFESLQMQALAELYTDHLTDGQLQALLDFYGSETGRSIVEAEQRIEAHMMRLLPEIAERAFAPKDREAADQEADRRGGARPGRNTLTLGSFSGTRSGPKPRS